jgi:hypothetical protein
VGARPDPEGTEPTHQREELDVKYGPVDVVVLAMGEPRFDGTIMAELERLASTGTIRVLDAMVLIMDETGAVFGLDIEDLPAEDAAKFGFINVGTRGLFDAEDSSALAEGMVPGSAVLALAIENAWAVPLMNDFISAGADIALHTRIPAPIVDDALAAIAAGKE